MCRKLYIVRKYGGPVSANAKMGQGSVINFCELTLSQSIEFLELGIYGKLEMNGYVIRRIQ